MLGVVDSINTIFSEARQGGGNMTTTHDNLFSPPKNNMETITKYRHLLRSLGMLSIHGAVPLKKQIAKFAMGL